MDSNIIAAILGGLAGLSVVGLERGWTALDKRHDRITEINSRHLNPVRLYCEETYFRLREIRQCISQNEGRCGLLLSVDAVPDISTKDIEWFSGLGCYLISSCYFTACLFAAMQQIREDIPYLKLRSGDDTALLTRMFSVSYAFLYELGIFYALQPVIGDEMWHRGDSRFISYREFCELLMEPSQRQWFDRLLLFYLEVGRGNRSKNVYLGLEALRALGLFVDRAAQGSDSIGTRLAAEASLKTE